MSMVFIMGIPMIHRTELILAQARRKPLTSVNLKQLGLFLKMRIGLTLWAGRALKGYIQMKGNMNLSSSPLQIPKVSCD